MTRDQKFQTQWNKLQPQIKQKWSKLSDVELNLIDGQRNKLIDQLQVKYGFAKEQAEKEVCAFENKAFK